MSAVPWLHDLVRVVNAKVLDWLPCQSACPTDPEAIVNGRRVLNLASFNYLGLANHPRVREAARDAIDRYGIGAGASSVIGGRTTPLVEAEEKLAEFMGAEAALLFNATTLANKGVAEAVLAPPLLPYLAQEIEQVPGLRAIFCDRSAHASVLDALSRPRLGRLSLFPHNDMAALDGLLADSPAAHKLIAVDGLYSMSADLADLPRLVELKRRHGAILMVDDAHAIGTIGPHGRGTPDVFGLRDEVELHVGSCCKALGVLGGFVTGSRDFIEYLRLSARSSIFMAAMPPSLCAAIREACRIVMEEPERRATLQRNGARFRRALRDLGLRVLGECNVFPVLIGDDERAKRIAADLFDAGIFAPAITYPGVERGQALVRMSLTSDHTEAHLARALDAWKEIGGRHGLR